ncbi:MAG: hypothetical protein JWM12_3152 [Ilumatobacteraceae bacterium]|nr:hypothetical protein [Ilumatobacteraceae bacterium]
MCVSLAAATVHATGAVDLITSADNKTGPVLHMKFGFGCELLVGLPVVDGVTVTYMVGVQIDLDTGAGLPELVSTLAGRATTASCAPPARRLPGDLLTASRWLSWMSALA